MQRVERCRRGWHGSFSG